MFCCVSAPSPQAVHDPSEETQRRPREEPRDDELSTAVIPHLHEEHYLRQSKYYFNSLESRLHVHRPRYARNVIRWEWWPWLMLTSLGRANIVAIDSLIRLFPCLVRNRQYRFSAQQPFVRCLVTVHYGDEVIRRSQPLSIYEEFTFNRQGEISFIEAWWARQGEQLPQFDSGGWPVEGSFERLSTKLPGLGSGDGTVRIDSPAVLRACEQHEDVADFCRRARKFCSYLIQEMVHDLIKNRETIAGFRLRERTNSFVFKTTTSSKSNGFKAQVLPLEEDSERGSDFSDEETKDEVNVNDGNSRIEFSDK